MYRVLRSVALMGALSISACDRGAVEQVDPPHESARQPSGETERSASITEELQVAEDAAESRPSTASPTEPVDGRPPHPAIPSPLEESQPAPSILEATTYRWLPGHWIWVGNQYVWQPGVWVYDMPGYVLLPSQWAWDGEYWTFRDVGWAAPGSHRAAYRPTALPDGSDSIAPTPDPNEAQVDLEVSASSYAVYVWTGTWVAPPIVYPNVAGALGEQARYARRIRSGAPAVPPEVAPAMAQPIEYEPPPGGEAAPAGGATPTAGSDEADYVPGVLHGGKRGEEELRLMQEEQEREAAEQEAAEDAVVVPYYWDYRPYYRPVRPRPPRPAPLPDRPPPRRR